MLEKKFTMAPARKKRTTTNLSKAVPSREGDPRDPNTSTNHEEQRESGENPTKQEITREEQEARVMTNLTAHEVEMARLRQEAEELIQSKQRLLDQAAA